ncbi:SLAP domain-containing protein [Psychrobacillus soli]|uniref:SLAP domain-containing protein n=1 Tax=Psychrobacillus soli TaxID=1543965 RepID=A0A544TD30_9BACI|nr:SLAP domain-containing protein [Psychrobacillus soli]TQR15335.1 SLAP domain-containing protein [Psychrobacillus soli]
MQKLEFEPSWDKTISSNDRQKIETIFLQTRKFNNHPIQLTPLWQAFNHKGELLVTVLIHNFTLHSYSFQNTKLNYIVNNEILVEHFFTLPSLSIQEERSMPWTFIFPKENMTYTLPFENGHLEIV